jgi:coenzyme F420-reducing hydrogenase gamma subunit
MDKPRLAIFDFACCEGCQLQIVNLEQEILDLLNLVQPVEWREAISDQSTQYDIALVEGSITRLEDEQRLKEIRKRAKVLVALGACATIGGVNRLKNQFAMDDVKTCVYGSAAGMPHLNTYPTKALDEIVKVDLKVHGCPINNQELAYIVRCLAVGTTPVIPNYPVCVECKLRETVCRYEYNEVCLGVITRAGCNAPCPAGGMFCYGCRGLVDEPNVNAAHDVMARYGRTVEELKGRMQMFNTSSEDGPCSKP